MKKSQKMLVTFCCRSAHWKLIMKSYQEDELKLKIIYNISERNNFFFFNSFNFDILNKKTNCLYLVINIKVLKFDFFKKLKHKYD